MIEDDRGNSSTYWGPYRSGHYFGMKVQHPDSPVFGLMWYTARDMYLAGGGGLPLRHQCKQSDGMTKYGWLENDGENFGVQEVVDKYVVLETSFVKRASPSGRFGGEWTAKFSVKPKLDIYKGMEVAMMPYMSLAETIAAAETPGDDTHSDTLRITRAHTHSVSLEAAVQEDTHISPLHISGRSHALDGHFALLFAHTANRSADSSTCQSAHEFHLQTRVESLDRLEEALVTALRVHQWPAGLGGDSCERSGGTPSGGRSVLGLVGDRLRDGETPNYVVYQLVGKVPFQLEVHFITTSQTNSPPLLSPSQLLSGHLYNTELERMRTNFVARFERVFRLSAKGYNESYVKFGRAAFSNLIGGISYFSGRSLICLANKCHSDPHKSADKSGDTGKQYWFASLLSAVPSRSFFPRGFLWDEGFHLILLFEWNKSIAFRIMAHWLDLMNSEGWIPREQILGSESRQRVPDEFVVQYHTYANPPTLFLALEHHFISSGESTVGALETDSAAFLARAWPRLFAWFRWFNTTQRSELYTFAYRWRGRHEHTAPTSPVYELNAKTLTSGLDDYPRASHPDKHERHLDLFCWMVLSARTLCRLGTLLRQQQQHEFWGHAQDLDDVCTTYKRLTAVEWPSGHTALERLHWSEAAQAYMDFGRHTDDVRLVREAADTPGGSTGRLVREQFGRSPTLRHVVQYGYVALFPFLLHILARNDTRHVAAVADVIRGRLLTAYGLRSLSVDSPLYMKANTGDDPPYWRAPVWQNFNYLGARALHYYTAGATYDDGSLGASLRALYTQLRTAMVDTMYREYVAGGFVYEQYSDVTGRGQGCRPFTGWSALVVVVMSEKY